MKRESEGPKTQGEKNSKVRAALNDWRRNLCSIAPCVRRSRPCAASVPHCMVTDTVRASASEHPYLAHTVAIAGKDQRLTRRIDARIERLCRRCETVENVIAAEEDSRDRLVLSLRYLEGASWREIGQRMGTGEDAARKRAERFFMRSQKSGGQNTGSSQ